MKRRNLKGIRLAMIKWRITKMEKLTEFEKRKVL